MPLTAEDVGTKKFTPVRLREGYDMGEVDQFLDEVEAELTRLHAENDDLRDKLTAAQNGEAVTVPPKAEPEPKAEEQSEPEVERQAPEPEKAPEKAPIAHEQIKVTTAAEASSAATRLLELATRNADELVAGAQEEAEQIVATARAEAERLESETKARTEQVDQEARTRAQSLDTETETKRRELLDDIEREKTRLDGEVENLRAFEREYRSRLKSYFSQQLASLDGQGEGGGSLDGATPAHPLASEGEHQG